MILGSSLERLINQFRKLIHRFRYLTILITKDPLKVEQDPKGNLTLTRFWLVWMTTKAITLRKKKKNLVRLMFTRFNSKIITANFLAKISMKTLQDRKKGVTINWNKVWKAAISIWSIWNRAKYWIKLCKETPKKWV